jgi:hypothetical protein
MSNYIYMTACPQLKGRAREFPRDYIKMAVVELEPGFEGRPKMISERARGVRRIVRCETWYVGKTARSEGYRRREELLAMVDELNQKGD